MLLKCSSSRGGRSVKTPNDPDCAAPEIHQCGSGLPIKNAPVCVGDIALCLELKRDREADQALGWVLEMWAYTLAAARTGVRHQAHLDFPRP